MSFILRRLLPAWLNFINFSLLFLQARTRLLSRKRPQGKYWKAPDWHGLTILTRNPLFLKLTLVLMLNGIVSEGLWEIMTQYLQLKLGFNTLDNVSLRCRPALSAAVRQGRVHTRAHALSSACTCFLPAWSSSVQPALGLSLSCLGHINI